MQNPKHHDFGMNKDDMDRFARVLPNINIDAISQFASTVRHSGHPSTNNSTPSSSDTSTDGPNCKVHTPPLSGSFHLVFPLEFPDGVVWMLKVPANGYGNQFDSLAASALVSEARTMQMIQKETTIPVPTIYAYDASLHNEIHVPFIMMERMDGIPLYQGWFEKGVPKGKLQKFRAKVLQELAAAMSQLNKFTVDQSGSLVFDQQGTPVNIDGAKVMDSVAYWNRQREGESIDADVYGEKGPCHTPKDFFMFLLSRPSIKVTNLCEDLSDQGAYFSLAEFIELASESADLHAEGANRRFVLAHPDFDLQNVLVAEDGTLRGLIDWDGVAAVPCEIGCATYPNWLMRDWVPTLYEYDVQNDEPFEDSGFDESSPEELECYRAMYAQFMEKENALRMGTGYKPESELTRRSLVMRSLDLASSSPMLTFGIIRHIYKQIEQITTAEWDEESSDAGSTSSDFGVHVFSGN
ncbi:hypothetical protein MMC28_006788 [Mycoblastus sanguinarius]|nr:hypothetical protein [Mycoblastus sanguinarius]